MTNEIVLIAGIVIVILIFAQVQLFSIARDMRKVRGLVEKIAQEKRGG